MSSSAPTRKLDYAKLLDDALRLEGKLSDCYSAFWEYSFNNQILAMIQAGPQPINTYKGWQKLGRQVRKGEKAIELCMPVSYKDSEHLDAQGQPRTRIRFIFRRHWFALSQTDGPLEYVHDPPVPAFDLERVMEALDIAWMPFESMNGNVQGYTDGKAVAINPVAKYPLKTLWHELGHVLLDHVAVEDPVELTRSVAEVEAEATAYLLCCIFGYEQPLEESRGYIQHWHDREGISPESAKRIFGAVTKILEANRPNVNGTAHPVQE